MGAEKIPGRQNATVVLGRGTLGAAMRPLLNGKENERLDEFAMQHYRKHEKTAEVDIRIHAKQTGLGYAVTVKCPHCKQTADVTDYDCW